MEKKRNPISFLEDSFLSMKGYLESEINSHVMTFDEVYINTLKKETLSILALCDVLNKDIVFIQKINTLAGHQSNGLLLKAEHFFISDIIKAYQKQIANANAKSDFALAYYYDALRNNHFADEKAIKTLNKLAQSNAFKNHLLQIRNENSITRKDSTGGYFLREVLSETNHPKKPEALDKLRRFMELSFDIKPESQTTDFLSIPVPAEENSSTAIPKDDTLEKVLEELNSLIGLDAVKKDVYELINLLEIQKKRTSQGLKNIDITLHTVFLGPPGTGKTTVARLLGRIFKHLGFLTKGQLRETDREGMVAGFVGQTATKVDKIVEESLGGVLFIDEAYALTQNAFGNDYGAEAVNILLKRMEDHRDDLAVVAAGYTEPMKIFIESNPGLRSRFNRFFHFSHFSPSELFRIFELYCKNSDFIISEEAKEKLDDTFELLFSAKDDGFGNARVVRNIFEKCAQNQANRIIKLSDINPEILKTFTEEDIPEPKDTLEQVNFFGNKEDNA